MGSMLDEEFDISALEINEYIEIVYKLLKFRLHKISGPNGKFRCPFCADKEEGDYSYTHLLQHAIRVADDSTGSAKQRANHLAMAAYLATDIASEADQSLPQSRTPSPPAESDDDRAGFKIYAKEFEKSSGACGRSGNDRRTSPGPSFYDLFASDDDNSEGHVGDYLSKRGALKTISDNFMNLLETEIRKLKSMASDHIRGVLEEQEMLNLELENKKQQLDSRSKELDKREAALTARERQNLKFEKIENDYRDPRLQEATKLQRDAEENCSRLVDRLKEKEDELFNLDYLYEGLFIKERRMNDELQDARRVLIKKGSRLDEDSDISDSEINIYKEATYKLLKFWTDKIRGHDGKFRCPFCAGKKKQDYQYTHLYQDAIRVAEGSEESSKQRANHFAMATYLVADIASEAESLPESMMPSPAAERDDDHAGIKIIEEFEKSSEACDSSRKEWIDRRTSPGNGWVARDDDDDDNSEGPVEDYLRKKGALKRISETRKLQRMAHNHIKAGLEEEELLNLELERKKQKLDSWSKELDNREALIERERQKLELEETEKDLRNNQMAEKLREADENYQRLVERLKEKEVALSNLEDLQQNSVLKERQSNDELQEVRLELIKLLSDVPSHRLVDIGLKRIGKTDEKTFMNACQKRFPPDKAEMKAVELRIFWEKKLREFPRWQPFQIIEDDKGNPQGLLRKDDRVLRGLKDEWGEEIYNVVYAALIDLDKDKRSGRYMAPELWNFKENRKATLREAISNISTQLKTK